MAPVVKPRIFSGAALFGDKEAPPVCSLFVKKSSIPKIVGTIDENEAVCNEISPTSEQTSVHSENAADATMEIEAVSVPKAGLSVCHEFATGNCASQACPNSHDPLLCLEYVRSLISSAASSVSRSASDSSESSVLTSRLASELSTVQPTPDTKKARKPMSEEAKAAMKEKRKANLLAKKEATVVPGNPQVDSSVPSESLEIVVAPTESIPESISSAVDCGPGNVSAPVPVEIVDVTIPEPNNDRKRDGGDDDILFLDHIPAGGPTISAQSPAVRNQASVCTPAHDGSMNSAVKLSSAPTTVAKPPVKGVAPAMTASKPKVPSITSFFKKLEIPMSLPSSASEIEADETGNTSDVIPLEHVI